MIGITITPNQQDYFLFADEQPQKKSAPEKSNITKSIENTDAKQNRNQKENRKRASRKNMLPVEPIIAEMKRAGKLIENQQTGEETQKLQQQVVQNLEQLIRQVESAPTTSRQQLKSDHDQQLKDEKKSRMQKSKTGRKSGNQLSQGPARQSSERKEEGQATAGSLANRNLYIKEAWGHLPPAMRQKLLNIYTEKFLPQYENQVRRYYEALAEQKKRSP
ncbi:MAG: hypothetical protein K0U86_23325 [Planctomycetes bacterium]|nr:hypothetical protein [Planctomycetota bacterium]MCH9727844.1 hypothetical protein [Planctomycetota bacterium]MCH9775488.1 hypothetical protein [Planctomycetota bacterium]MDF1744387.1 hypothetical protein [Gimesia sp.]